MMPELDGLSVCRAVRRTNDVPIIFLTALSDEEDKLLGYELGADDYVTKPFTMSVLYAKTMALIKRNQRNVLAGDRMEVSGITLELTAGRAYAGGKEVFLTPKEFSLLRCLMQNKNLVMSREQLLVKCWGYDYEGESRAVDTHIKRLREKLGDYAECIKTVIKGRIQIGGMTMKKISKGYYIAAALLTIWAIVDFYHYLVIGQDIVDYYDGANIIRKLVGNSLVQALVKNIACRYNPHHWTVAV